MAGITPCPPTGGAGWPAAPSLQDKQQHPFGPSSAPRPPGVGVDKSPPVSGAGVVSAVGWGQQGPVQGQPQPIAAPGEGPQHFTQGASGAFGSPPPRSPAGSPAFGEHGTATADPSRSPAQNGAGNGSPNDAAAAAIAMPGAGAAAVAKRLLNRGGADGGGSTGTPAKGVPHVSSAPVLGGKGQGGSEGRDSPENGGGGVAAAAAADGGGGGGGAGKGRSVEQAPKSEPRKGAKDKNIQRRASVGGAAMAAKPGRLAKMMSKWLYPEAKVSYSSACGFLFLCVVHAYRALSIVWLPVFLECKTKDETLVGFAFAYSGLFMIHSAIKLLRLNIHKHAPTTVRIYRLSKVPHLK